MSTHARHEGLPLRYDNPALHPMVKPPPISLVELGTVAVGFLFALVAPALVVSPTADSAPGTRLALAFSLTVLGVLVAVLVAMLAYRRTHNYSWLVIAVVPTISLMATAAIMAGSKAG